jgi:hypothetical protein
MPRLLLIAVLSTLGACTHVQPWERGTLASDAMALDPTPLQTPLRDHVYQSREAGASGRLSGGGAGCGCY